MMLRQNHYNFVCINMYTGRMHTAVGTPMHTAYRLYLLLVFRIHIKIGLKMPCVTKYMAELLILLICSRASGME